jgi:hypothetical protein
MEYLEGTTRLEGVEGLQHCVEGLLFIRPGAVRL